MAHGDTGSLDRSVPPAKAEAPPAARSRPFAIVLIAVLSLGALAVLAGPALRAPPGGDVLDGSWTAALEEALLEDTPLLEAAQASWAAIDLVVFRQGLPGVLIGRDGWLFSTEEFAPSEVEARFTTEAPVARIAAFHDRLAADGVDLEVVLVPSKARMRPDALGRYELPEATEARYGVLRDALREEGVSVTDGAAAMAAAGEDASVFLRTDTHWTPDGAAAVAESVANRMTERHGDADWLGATPFDLAREAVRPVEGDLTAYVPLGPLEDALGPEPDRIAPWRATRADAADADPFGEVRLPVALVGTSYSADERWGFADRLRAALGADVLVAATEGEGPFEPMRAYLEGEAYANARPEVVIWEIPERYAWPEVGW